MVSESTLNSNLKCKEPKEKSLEDFFCEKLEKPGEDQGHYKYWQKKGLHIDDVPEIRHGYYDGKAASFVPFGNIDGKLNAIQIIDEDGGKGFKKGSKPKGTFYPPIEEANTVYLTEGVATAASLQKIVKPDCVLSCGSASNIPDVAEAIQKRYPKKKIIIAPDRPKNTAKEVNDAVNNAVKKCSDLGLHNVVYPMKPEGASEEGYDWNDCLNKFSHEEIYTDIKDQLLEIKKKKQKEDEDAIVEDYSEEESHQDLSKHEPFPIEALPSNVVEYAKELAEKNIIALEIVVANILSICSLGVQGKIKIKTGHGDHPLSLYFVTAAGSGEGKTTIENILEVSVNEKEKEAYEKRVDQMEVASHKLKLWEKDKKVIPADDIQEFIKNNPKPKLPPDPKIIISDATIEGIQKQFNKGRDSLGLFSSEGIRFFGGHSMRDGKDMHTIGALSNHWDSKPIERTRGAEGEGLKLFDKDLTINISIQKEPFSKVWENPLFQDQGILARFLTASPAPKAGTRIRSADRIEYNHAEPFKKRVRELLEEQEDRRETVYIELSDEARKLNIEYYNEIERETGIGGKYQDIKAFASKTAEQARRIAGVITLFEGSSRTEIGVGAMKKGIITARWYLNEALRISNESLIDEKQKNQRILLDFLKAKGNMTMRHINQYGPSKVRKGAILQPILKVLEKQGKVSKNDRNEWVLMS